MLQYLKAYTPFWKKVNGILGIMLALVILVSTLSVFGMLFVLDGAENENAMLPTRTEYEEPYIRIGLSYGSSVKASYAFTATQSMTYGYNLHQDAEFVGFGQLPAGDYSVSIGGGYTVWLSHFEDPDTDVSDFFAVLEKAREVLGVYNQPIFPMLTTNGLVVCIGMYDTLEEAASQAEFMYFDLGMDQIFGGDDDITEEEPPEVDPPVVDPPVVDPPEDDLPEDEFPEENLPEDEFPEDEFFEEDLIETVGDDLLEDEFFEDDFIEEPPVIDPPADEPSTEEPPVVDPPTDEPSTEEPPVVDPPTDEPSDEEPPVVDPPIDDPIPEPPVVLPMYLELETLTLSDNNSLVLYDSNKSPVYGYDAPMSYEKHMAVWCDFSEGALITVGSDQYESHFEFIHYKSGSTNGVSVITVIPLETYIRGVLAKELYPSWDLEVQKAFAVIIRTYTLSNPDKHASYGFSLCATTNCQVYEGCRKVNDNIRTAVAETKGIVLTEGNKTASVNYATVGGGSTVNCEESWVSPRTYLKAVPTPWERYRDYGNLTSGGVWHVEMTGEQLYQKLASSYPVLKGEIVDCHIDQFCTNSSYVYQITFTDKYGNTATVKKADTIRNRLGLKSGNFVIGKAGQTVKAPVYELDCYPSVYNNNRTHGTYVKLSDVTFESVWSDGLSFVISGLQKVATKDTDIEHDLDHAQSEVILSNDSFYANEAGLADILNSEITMYYENVKLESTSGNKNVFVIEGKGYGHGIGICQYGAWDLARAGYDYLTILRYYFKNVTFGVAADFIN